MPASKYPTRQDPLGRLPDPTFAEPEELVERCLRGGEEAWSQLVNAYRPLVISIIRRNRAASAEEDDVFQAVWIDIFNDLSKLRDRSALRFWIAAITRHHCYHWRHRASKRPFQTWDWEHVSMIEDPALRADSALVDTDRRLAIRKAIRSLEPRCRQLLELLFLEDPPVPYAQVAEKLGLAVGSIGALRETCLERLRSAVRKRDIH